MRWFRCVWASRSNSSWDVNPTTFVYAKTVQNHVKLWETIKGDAVSSYFLMVDPLIIGPDETNDAILEGDVAAARTVAKSLRNAKAGLGR